MKVAIIGGGIAGLYLGYKLSQRDGFSVTIFEKSDRLGGRIYTVETKVNGTNVGYEAGAGRFNESHQLLMKLLKDLDLLEMRRPIGLKRSFVHNSRKRHYDKIVKELLFERVVNSAKNYTDDFLKSVTLREFMTSVIGDTKTQNVIDAFGYNSEFELQNAYTSLKIFENDFNDNIQYFFLSGGLSQIVEKLAGSIVNSKGKINMNTEVCDYDHVSNSIKWKKSKRTYSGCFDKVVFCVTKQALLSFNPLINHDTRLHRFLTQSIEMSPLHRIFVKFPLESNGTAWFHDLNRTTTNLHLRYFIPLNPLTGLIQLSYTDKQYADYWNSFQNDDEVIKALMKDVKMMYPDKAIPQPEWISRHYWKEGATYWLPSFKRYNNNKNSNYYICGEMTSQFHNAWIEGALESVERVIKCFN